jgi:APA family basic amino acid/polyamine antiporter
VKLAGPKRQLPGGAHSVPPDLSPVEHGGLQRVLGVPALFSTAYGNVGSSIYYALGLVAALALGLTPVAFLIAGIIFVMTALTYAEGTVMYPEAGGSSSFARHAFNEMVSFCTAWAQLLNYIITMAISAYFVPHYLAFIWEPLSGTNGSPWDVIGGIVVIAILAYLNIVGVKETAALNVGLALADLGTQVLLALLGMFLLLSPSTLVNNVHWGVAPTWTAFATSITIAMIAYTGIETISNMAEETRDPVRSVPRAIMWVVVAVLGLYAILPVVALSALPVHLEHGKYVTELGTKYAGDPFIGFVNQFDVANWVKTFLRGYVGSLAAIILFIATNAAIIGVSRVSYSMGQHRQMPTLIRAVHPKYATPYMSIAIFSVIGAVLLLPGLYFSNEAELLGNLYAFGAMLSFSIAHLSVIALRLKKQGESPWRAPMNVMVKGRRVPIFAVLGLFGTGSAWFVQVALHPTERWIGLGWMIVGVAVYYAYRKTQGLSLTETVRAPVVVQPPSLDIAYRNILVPILSGKLDRAALVTACKLASDSGAIIVVLATIEVPQSLPLSAGLPEAEADANRELDYARAIGEEYGVRVLTRISRVRRAERAIIDEAIQRESQLIVVGVPRRRLLAGMGVLGRSVERAMRRSPTRVLLVRPALHKGNPAMQPVHRGYVDRGRDT